MNQSKNVCGAFIITVDSKQSWDYLLVNHCFFHHYHDYFVTIIINSRNITFLAILFYIVAQRKLKTLKRFCLFCENFDRKEIQSTEQF